MKQKPNAGGRPQLIRRRDLVAMLGGATFGWPHLVRAQPGAARVGMLGPGLQTSLDQAIRDGLGKLGYVEGRNLILESLSAEGHSDRLPAFAARLIADKMEVIFGEGSQATRALLAQTTTLPIVMASADPIGDGFVTNIARPGGNVTGVSLFGPELTGKRLGLLKELVPSLVRLAVFWNPEDPSGSTGLQAIERAASALSIKVQNAWIPLKNSLLQRG